ncbi:MAG: glutathione peroxidase [Bacilli bacterium]|jgi:glutathione peroxidase|nr:glutathione peroxidase [Bacilli bacterium]
MGIYGISVETDHDEKISLSLYSGKVLLIVNSATKCVFTPQYKGLQALYERFRGSGFEILDFPCSQFLNQAPGTVQEINEFCDEHYKTSFPRFEKIDVNGPDESLLFTYLKKARHGFFGSRIKWNFTKFLIDRKGKVRKRYSPSVKPERIAKDIEKLLKEAR